MKEYRLSDGISRRKFIRAASTAAAVISAAPAVMANSFSVRQKPDSKFAGVQIGAITYSWRSMPSTAEDILKYCVEGGISSIELMGNVAEEYAGIPPLPPRPSRGAQLSDKAKDEYQKSVQAAEEERRKWRLSLPMSKYRELSRMFKKAGVNIHIVKFSPAGWTDDEIDYAFKSAKILGANGVTNEIGHEACKRLGKFARKHNMYAIYHNHLQPGEPGFNFDDFLAYSPNNMLNFDAGHYYGATGDHPNNVIKRLYNRIYSIHLKDKTGPDSQPANTNTVWGEGETPIADMLKLIRDEKWPIYCDIELEYPVPDGSDAQKEVIKCVNYCKEILE